MPVIAVALTVTATRIAVAVAVTAPFIIPAAAAALFVSPVLLVLVLLVLLVLLLTLVLCFLALLGLFAFLAVFLKLPLELAHLEGVVHELPELLLLLLLDHEHGVFPHFGLHVSQLLCACNLGRLVCRLSTEFCSSRRTKLAQGGEGEGKGEKEG